MRPSVPRPRRQNFTFRWMASGPECPSRHRKRAQQANPTSSADGLKTWNLVTSESTVFIGIDMVVEIVLVLETTAELPHQHRGCHI